MAERKPIRQLKVAVTPGISRIQEVREELKAKGHEVVVLPDLDQYDLVLGYNCHRFSKSVAGLLKLMIKSARNRKYGAKGNREVEGYVAEDETG